MLQVGSEKEERRGQRNGGHRITVSMPSGSPGEGAVSAAILAKVHCSLHCAVYVYNSMRLYLPRCTVVCTVQCAVYCL